MAGKAAILTNTHTSKVEWALNGEKNFLSPNSKRTLPLDEALHGARYIAMAKIGKLKDMQEDKIQKIVVQLVEVLDGEEEVKPELQLEDMSMSELTKEASKLKVFRVGMTKEDLIKAIKSN